MAAEGADIVILRRTSRAYGVRAGDYAEELRERLPNYEIRVARTIQEERELLPEARVVAGMEIDSDLLELAENLELFHCGLAGVEQLPLEEMKERGIAVTNASGVHAANIAEHAIGSMLLFARRFHDALRRQDEREWRHFAAFDELNDSTVTVVGMGSVGRGIITRLNAFGAYTIGARYTPSKGGPADEVIGFGESELHEALARTDYLVVASPLSDATRGLIGDTEINTLHQDAVIVNIARGAIIDTDALVRGLQCNQLHGAALDVTDPEPLPPDHPLWTLNNVLLTPHSAGDTPEFWARVADILAENVRRAEETGSFCDLKNQVAP